MRDNQEFLFVETRVLARLARRTFLAFIFIIFLYPFSIDIAGQGASANYLYLLFPLAGFFIGGKIRLPKDRSIFLLMTLYALVFLASLLYQYEFYQFTSRRIISFILFFSIFSYVFIEIDFEMIRAFRIAIVSISIWFIVETTSTYFSMGGNALGALAKSYVGNQRFGFIYLSAFWIVMIYKPDGKIQAFARIVGVFIIAVGLLLTFSRSSVVALLGSLTIYFFSVRSSNELAKYPHRQFLRRSLIYISSMLVLFIALWILFPSVYDFYVERLFSVTSPGGEPTFDLDNPEASEGVRVYILQTILSFVAMNPFTGAGFLGVWVMFEDFSGSAHNQYTDILFRTGVLGFLAYMLLLFRLSKFLKNTHDDLFYGFWGILIYGLFHETFKESQGAFLLTFLLGMMFSSKKCDALTDLSSSK